MNTRFGTTGNLTAAQIDQLISINQNTFVENGNMNLLNSDLRVTAYLGESLGFVPKTLEKKTVNYTGNLNEIITNNYAGTWYKEGWFSQKTTSDNQSISFAYGNEIFYSKNNLPYTDERSTGVYINANWSGLNVKFDSDNFVIGGFINADIILDTGSKEPFPYKNFYEIFEHSGIQVGDMGSNFIAPITETITKECSKINTFYITPIGVIPGEIQGGNLLGFGLAQTYGPASILFWLPSGESSSDIEVEIDVGNRIYSPMVPFSFSPSYFIKHGYTSGTAEYLTNFYNTKYKIYTNEKRLMWSNESNYISDIKEHPGFICENRALKNYRPSTYFLRYRKYCSDLNAFSVWQRSSVTIPAVGGGYSIVYSKSQFPNSTYIQNINPASGLNQFDPPSNKSTYLFAAGGINYHNIMIYYGCLQWRSDGGGPYSMGSFTKPPGFVNTHSPVTNF
jgi:hypothetical protein